MTDTYLYFLKVAKKIPLVVWKQNYSQTNNQSTFHSSRIQIFQVFTIQSLQKETTNHDLLMPSNLSTEIVYFAKPKTTVKTNNLLLIKDTIYHVTIESIQKKSLDLNSVFLKPITTVKPNHLLLTQKSKFLCIHKSINPKTNKKKKKTK